MKKYLLILSLLLSFVVAAQEEGKIVFDWWANSDSYGFVTNLLQKSGNGSTDIKVRLVYNGKISGGTYQGTWASGSTYALYDRVTYPASSPLVWRALGSVSAGNTPFTISNGVISYNVNWALDIGMEMIQNLGGSNYMRYGVGFNDDDFIRTKQIQYGTLAASQFTLATSNLDDGFNIGNSASSIAMPTALGQSRSFTIDAGLTYSNKSSVGSCTDNLSIPLGTDDVTFINVTLPTGQTINPGQVLKFENSASNFFVGVAARYSSITGAAYVAVINPVGSGTFSSWTVYKTDLLLMRWASDLTGTYFYGLIDNYNSGTGVTDVTVVSYLGTGTRTTWNVSRGKQGGLIPASQGVDLIPTLTNPTAGQKLGSFYTFKFVGTRLIHQSNKRADGVGFKYIITSTTGISDVTIDTYNSTTITLQDITVFDNLPFGSYTGIAIAVKSPTVASTNIRAPINFSTNSSNDVSFLNQVNYDVFTSTIDITAAGDSMGELAWRFRDTDGGDTPQWVPDHAGVFAAIGRSRVFNVSGSVIDVSTLSSNSYLFSYQTFTTATLSQSCNVIHSQASGNVFSLTSTHTLNRYGLEYDVTMSAIQNGVIVTGYNNMLHLSEPFFQKMKCFNGEYVNRPADNTTVNLSATQASQGSYIFYSTSASTPQRDLAVSMYIFDPSNNWRTDLSPTGFIQDFTGTSGAKFYPQPYSGYSFTTGFTQRIRAKLYAGNFPNANAGL